MKGLFEPATSYVRDQDVNKETNKIQITEQNFKLISIHASVIYQIPEIP